ncbi:unnamed protein product [Coccothraustes coccothraustes]
MEPKELSLALLQPQVTVVAILGELLATLRRRAEMMLLLMSVRCLYRDLDDFTKELRSALYHRDDPWRYHNVTCDYDDDPVTSDDDDDPVTSDDDDDPPSSLIRALAACKSARWTSRFDVQREAREWQWSVDVLVDRWAELARKATKLCNTCRVTVTEAGYRVATATARARELQDKAARYGTAQENMEELGQALGGEEATKVVAGREAQVRREATEAASKARRATMVRQRVEAALGLLERLVAACDEATAFPRELQHLLRVTKAALERTNEASHDVPEELVAKVAVAKQLWEANTRLAKDHLGKRRPDPIKFLFTGDLDSSSACGVAERCQRAMEDIPRLLRPPECPQVVPRVSPVSMELQELSPALLQPQVTVVAILGELLATLPGEDKETLLMSPLRLCWDLEEFTNALRTTLCRTDDTWWRDNVATVWRQCAITMDDDDPVTSLSQALAAYKSTPGTPQNCVTVVASKWQRSVAVLVNSWAELARTATELRSTCRDLATEAADREATATTWARELQAEAARYGTAQENMEELGQALGREVGAEVVAGHEAQVRREAMEAASKAGRATMVRQRLEAAQGLLERLVAACDEAATFPRELHRRVGDIEAALKGTNEASCDVPEELVAKVAVAEWLWEANARLAKDHLAGALQDVIDCHFACGPESPHCCKVAKWYQRAIEDIPRLIRDVERPQGVPKVSPGSMEPQELSPALLHPAVTVVAILGELLATLPRLDEMMLLLLSPSCLYWDLMAFTRELQSTLYSLDAAWWHRKVTSSDDDPVTLNDDDPPTSLSQALAAYKSTPWTTWKRVTMVASKWQRSVSLLLNSWAELARKATKIRSICRDLATEAANRVATATARARELQAEAGHYGTAQENMVELGQALGREEGAEVVAGREAQVRREAMVAASKATRATMVRQRVEVALGLLERLVAACDEATAFPRELQRLLRDTEAALKWTKKQSLNVLEELVAKVAEAERLWEANAHLAKDHLLGTLPDTIKFCFTGGPTTPRACGVAEQCLRAIGDIPRLLQPPACPQSIPNMFPVSMELQELSKALLQPQVTVVAILGELLATLHRQDERMMLLVSPKNLCWDLEEFRERLQYTLHRSDDPWWHRTVTYGYDDDECPTSLSRALAAYKSTPWTSWKHVTMVARQWQRSVSLLLNSWAELAGTATEIRSTCREVANEAATKAATATARARELQAEVARYGTAQENMEELGQALGREEGAEVVAGREAQVRREARVAAREATRATMERQRLEAALGLLERLVAACDEATAFPQELHRRVGDIKAALQGTNEASANVPEDLVAKVAEAEQLWEANAHLAKGHLEAAVDNIKDFAFEGTCFSISDVAERCQRAIGDIPRLLQPPEHPQSVPRVSPVSMEPQELSLALLQPQVTVVAILGKLLDTLWRLDEEMLPMSLRCLCWDLEEFTKELWNSLHYVNDTWWRCTVTSDDNDPVTSLSQALAAYKSTPGTTPDVTMVASKWQRSVAVLVNSWAQLARKVTELCKACREVDTEVAEREATATARARERQAKAARYGTAQENMEELGQALGGEEGAEVVAGHEAQVRREARVAAREATRATMVRQRVEVALGLLERLVAACDEATAFPWELQRRVGDIEATLKGTNEASRDVPEELVAKVAVAERLWEANARLAKDHLEGTLQDIIKFYFGCGPDSPHCRRVAKWCQRAIEDIPRLLRHLERPQGVPKVSPVSMEPQELSPALLQPQVTVVAILGELLATLPKLDEEMLLVSPGRLYWKLQKFTKELQSTLNSIDTTWWHRSFTVDVHNPVSTLSQALAAYKSTPWTTWDDVRMAASKWQRSVDALEYRWAQLARKATKLRNICRVMANEAADMVALHTTQARALQAEAGHYGTAQENMEELGQALGGEEGSEVVAGTEAWVRREARVASSKATRATMERQRVEAALGLLERLVAACDEATAFPRELQRLLRDTEAALKGTNEASRDVPEDLVAMVAEVEWLWEANARLAKDHLGKTVPDSIELLFTGDLDSPSAREGAEQCQRAIEDIARLLRSPEHPERVPRVSPVSMEPQEVSPVLLQPQVTMVAILGELLAILPSEDEMNLLLTSSRCLYSHLGSFCWQLRAIQHRTELHWWHHNVTSDDDDPPTSLSCVLPIGEIPPGTHWKRVTMAARKWQQLVLPLTNSWAELARKATKLRNACRVMATEAADRAATATARARELQAEAARYGTAQENMVELSQALGREEGAKVVAGREAQVRRQAMVAASEATRATMVRQRVEEALGLLERLVAACDEATAFPRELQRLLRDTKATLKGTNEASRDVPEDLVAKVAEAEQLWEANAHLVKDHLEGAIDDIMKFCFDGGPVNPSACGVSERCQRAIEDIARLLRPLERPQGVPEVSPVSTEPQELSPALLRAEVTAVATLGELLDTLPRQDEEVNLLMFPACLYKNLEKFTSALWDTLYSTKASWWHQNVITNDDDLVTSLSRALAACEMTAGTPQNRVTMAVSEWQGSVAVLVNSWAWLARAATKLRNACRDLAPKAADMVASTTAWARELQAEAARYGTAQENMVELGQALGREEGAEVVAGHEAQVRRQAMVAASRARRATMVRQRVEAALGLLERLVAACDEATAFPRELQRLLRDTKAALKGTNEASANVPEDLVAKVAEAERLWEANARLAKDHLAGAVDNLIEFYITAGPNRPSACEVAERCQRATEDIPRLLQCPECPQSVPKLSPVSMEAQELQVLVAVVATLGKVVAAVTGPQRDKSPNSLHEHLKNFTRSLRAILNHGGVTSLGHPAVPSLGRALATLRATPGTTWANVRAAACAWRELVARLVDSWDWLAREATRLCEKVVTEQQLMVALDKEEVAREMATHDAQVAAATNEAMAEAVGATRRGHWAKVALGPLQRLVATCDRATLFNWTMEWQLRDIEALLKGTNEVSPDVLQALVFKVAKFQWLWDASTRLAKDHLLGALGDIDSLLLSPCGAQGGPSGPGSRAVAERCQKAIEDIPRLLQESFT